MAKNRIEEIRAKEDQKKRDALSIKQLNERLEVEEAHRMEFDKFNQMWDKTMNEFQEHSLQLETSMADKHITEMDELKDNLERTLPAAPKPSPELHHLRSAQLNLAKQQNYVEAHKVQSKATEMEEEELKKWNKVRAQKIAASEAQLANKHDMEAQALRKKIESGLTEQKKQRAIELERLLQRYQNIKRDLESHQKIERQKFEKSQTTSKSGHCTSQMNRTLTNMGNQSPDKKSYSSNSRPGSAMKRNNSGRAMGSGTNMWNRDKAPASIPSYDR